METAQSRSSLTDFRTAAGIVCLTFLVYFPVTRAGFIWDDDNYVVRNVLLRDWAGLRDIWLTHRAPQYYPAVFTSFWLEYQLYQLNPLGYHLINVALHAANAVLVAVVLKRLKFRWAWWVAALFAVHPVTVESVAWVTERKNVLSMLFYLTAFERYLAFDETKSRRAYYCSLFLFVMALFSKTVTCTLPAVLVLVMFYKYGKAALADAKTLAPYFAIGLALGLHTAFFEQTQVGQSASLYLLSWHERILLSVRIVVFYLGKILWPSSLIFNYPKWQLQNAGFAEYSYVLSAGLVLTALWKMFEKGIRLPAFVFVCYVLCLFPALGIFDVYPFRFSYVADHFQYLAAPSGLMLAVLAEQLLLGKLLAISALKFCYRALLLAALGILTWQQTLEYETLETHYETTLRKNPCSVLALNNLGSIEAVSGNLTRAKNLFDTLIVCDGNYLEGRQNRGALLLRLNNLDGALTDYNKAIELAPHWGDLYYGRAHVNFRLGKMRDAFRDLNQAIALKPAPEFYALRGTVYLEGAKDKVKACADWQEACEAGFCGELNKRKAEGLCT